MKRGLRGLVFGLPLVFFCQISMAAMLDFTDSQLIGSLSSVSNGYRGTIAGIGFTLTSTNGAVKFNERYDGSSRAGCQSTGGVLKCDKDGAGIVDDEISGIGVGNEKLTLVFDSVVNISGLHFLDLYVNPNGVAREQATFALDGVSNTLNATATPGDGGYGSVALGSTRARTIEFTAALGSQFWDDHNNDYALGGVEVSAVPVPAALWLFGTAIVGVIGSRRVKK